MTQNIYDDQTFFEGYAQLNRSVNGLEGAPEWPALKAMLPDVQSANVIDWAAVMAGSVAMSVNRGPRRCWGWTFLKRC